MNKQRKVLITITYNEMGIIIDTKAEEIEQPNLQPICNQLATDCISRQDAIDALSIYGDKLTLDNVAERIYGLPSIQPEIIRCKDCWHYPSEYADCPMIGWARNENDFCSKAERRTDEIN